MPNKIANEIDTKFATASGGKIFVAVVILQLIKQGKLSFNTCIGSILDFDLKQIDYKTNIYSVDVKGSGAGGAFITVNDIERFWVSLLNYKLISKEYVDEMISPQAKDGDDIYGYGIWIENRCDNLYKYHIEGLDPGISFYSSLDREEGLSITLVSNTQKNVWKYYREIIEEISS